MPSSVHGFSLRGAWRCHGWEILSPSNKSPLKESESGLTDVRTLLLFLTLLGFWLLLSGQFDKAFLVGSGVVSCLLTVYCCHRLNLIGESYQPIESLPRFLFYLPWLIFKIVLSSLEVTRLSWGSSSAILPRFVKVPVKIRHPLARTLLANSITLTPGTVTVDVTDDHYLVHALTEAAEEGVLDGSAEKRVAPMVPGSDRDDPDLQTESSS